MSAKEPDRHTEGNAQEKGGNSIVPQYGVLVIIPAKPPGQEHKEKRNGAKEDQGKTQSNNSFFHVELPSKQTHLQFVAAHDEIGAQLSFDMKESKY
jgi:hypothetical protein